jgi:hypothetical protein
MTMAGRMRVFSQSDVIRNPMATVLTLNILQEMNSETIFGQAVFAILRKRKREATPHTSQRKLPHFFFCPNAQTTTFITLNN